MKKITKDKLKKHARKIKDVTEEEFAELQSGYTKLMENVRSADTPMLLIIAVIGVAIVLMFRSPLFDLIGLIVFAYPIYLFVRQDGHEEGYFEGYYDHKCKVDDK